MNRRGLILAAAVVAASVVVPTVGSASPSLPGCGDLTFSGSTATVTCSYTGSLQQFTYPDDVSFAAFTIDGAEGGYATNGGDLAPPPLGGQTTGTIQEPAGTSLTILVGGTGAEAIGGAGTGGYGGGGNGSTAGLYEGFGGGGGSFVYSGSSLTTTSVVAVAGGGGGDTFVTCGNGPSAAVGGAGGGSSGGTSPATGCEFSSGGGGTSSQGGTAGGTGATGGAFGQGGNGTGAGGGGGGGYYGGGGGGGGGAGGGGGGGGSGFPPGGAGGATSDIGTTTSDVRAGNGVVTISYTPPATELSLSSDTDPSASGQSVTFTATLAGSGDRDGGTVAFSDGGTVISGCDASTVSSGTATCTTSDLSVDSHDVTAAYTGDADDQPATNTNSLNQTVDQAVPTVGLTADPASGDTVGRAVTLTVLVTSPYSGAAPSGSVDIADTTGTSASLGAACDAAVLTATSTPGQSTASCTTSELTYGSRQLTAAYPGDTDYTAASNSITYVVSRVPPKITATATSKHAKTKYGWYNSPVTVKFTCTAGSTAFTSAGCPKSVTVSKQTAGQTVTGTVSDIDGTSASVSVKIKLDTTKPELHLFGAKNHHTYASVRTLHCSAYDKLSKLTRPCKIVTRRNGKTVDYAAFAEDRAGNLTTKSGSYKLS